MKEHLEEREAVYTTIVGGRPPGCGTKVGAIPRGIEVLVKKASIDPEFKDLLIRERGQAAAVIKLELTPAETAILAAIPAAQLEKIIISAKVAPLQKKAFLSKAAALMLAALGASLLPGCKVADKEGIKPVQPEASTAAVDQQDQPDKNISPPVVRGTRPDRPNATRGIQPDRPKTAEPARDAKPDNSSGLR